MPVTLAKIASNTATATLNFEQGSLNVTYYPLRITDATLALLTSFTGANDEAAMFAKLKETNEVLVSIVKSWDLLEDDGETVIPLTMERMEGVSPVIKSLVIQAIIGDIRPENLAPQMKTT